MTPGKTFSLGAISDIDYTGNRLFEFKRHAQGRRCKMCLGNIFYSLRFKILYLLFR